MWRPPQLARGDTAMHQRVVNGGSTTSPEAAAVVFGDAGDELRAADASVKPSRADEEVVCVCCDAVGRVREGGERPSRFSGQFREVRVDMSYAALACCWNQTCGKNDCAEGLDK